MNASKHVRAELDELEGPEKLLSIYCSFRAEHPNKAQDLVRKALLWAKANQLEDPQFQQIRKRVGFDQPFGFFDLREELLDTMAGRIGALYDELGPDLVVWSIILLASRPQKGGTASLLADVAKCRAQTSAMDILECLVTENSRRETEERYE
jgi:hypothetical protein